MVVLLDRKQEIFDLNVKNGTVLNTNGVWNAITTCDVPSIARRAHLIKFLILRDRFIFHYDAFSSAAIDML